MKSFRLAVLICTFAAFGLVFPKVQNTVLANQQGQPEKENICFRWAFGALVGNNNNQELISVTRDTTLKTGDRFQMLVELKKKSFVYLIYHGANDEMNMLVPNGPQKFINNCKILKTYYMPQKNQWFVLDKNVGLETFYLLASVERLTKLESFINEYESAKSAGKPKLATKILKEIRTLIRQHRRFASAAERPISIGGSVRGINKFVKTPAHNIEKFAVEISATDFFSRTFTIEHKEK